MASDTLEHALVEQQLNVDAGDHELFSHYVTTEAWGEGYMLGQPVTALCGKVWVPSKDPKKYPVCPDCQEVFDDLDD